MHSPLTSGRKRINSKREMWKNWNNSIAFICILIVLILQSNKSFCDENQFVKFIKWCTISSDEQTKCEELSKEVDAKISEFGEDYRKIKCIQGSNKENCMTIIDEEVADLTSVDPGLVYIGSRYHSLIPIMQEVHGNRQTHNYSVAVIKSGTLHDVQSLWDLKGKKACFPAVGTLAGWFIPVSTLIKHGGMNIEDCNNHIKTAINYFGDSCAVNSLISKYNPIGDNSDRLCRICGGTLIGEKCTVNDPYYGYYGAIMCLRDKGEIAFIKHSTLDEVDSRGLELLCKDGSRQPVSQYGKCNWGRVPSDAIVTTTAKTIGEKDSYQRFFKKLVEVFGEGRSENNPTNRFTGAMYRSKEMGLLQNLTSSTHKDLLLQDSTNDLQPVVGSRQLFSGFLHDNMNHITGVRACPISIMTLCVSSDIEYEKCLKMKTALNAQMLKPEMRCFKTDSQIKCMEAIKNRFADIAVFDASDIYDAGKFYDLIPFMSEIYDLGTPEYYAIAVVKDEDPSTELTYLKNKYTCHTGINMADGWTIPLAILISNGWIRTYECDPIRSASEYFTKSCVPGSLSYEYTKDRAHLNLCDLCHGSTYRFCNRNPSEEYSGTSGAFRCLVEGGGDVAFVRHTTVFENTDGKKKEIWARNLFSNDFQLLCVDGKRAEVKNYTNCALGKVKANAIVTRGGRDYNETEVKMFINLFSYAQQFYGRKNIDYLSFGLFSSPSPHSNVIFQDATTRLEVIPKEMRNYKAYLGRNFLRAKKIVDCR